MGYALRNTVTMQYDRMSEDAFREAVSKSRQMSLLWRLKSKYGRMPSIEVERGPMEWAIEYLKNAGFRVWFSPMRKAFRNECAVVFPAWANGPKGKVRTTDVELMALAWHVKRDHDIQMIHALYARLIDAKARGPK